MTTTATDWSPDERAALRFLHAQSYGAGTAAGAIDRVDPRGALDHGARLAVPASWFSDPAARAVREAFRIRRVTPSETYPVHRAFPSARGVGVALGALHRDGPLGPSSWHYDPVRDEMVHVAGSAQPGRVTRSAAVLVDPVGLPAVYGDLRYALSFLEAGHAAMTLAGCLAQAGVPAAGRTDFADAELDRTFGVRPGQAAAVWFPLGDPAVADLSHWDDAAAPAEPGPVHPVVLEDRRCRHSAVVAVVSAASPGQQPRSAPAVLGLPASLDRRSSGAGTHDVVAGAGAIAAEVVDDLEATLGRTWALEDSAGAGPVLVSARTATGVEHRLVTDDPATHDLLAPALHRDPPALLRALTTPGRSLDGGPLPLAVTWLVDYPALVRQHGPRAQRTVQIRLGWAAQQAGLVLARHGLFARPRRSIAPALVDGVLGLQQHRLQVGYQLVGGRDAAHVEPLVPDLDLPTSAPPTEGEVR